MASGPQESVIYSNQMTFSSSDHIDNEDRLSLLLQIVEADDELHPVFYIATGEDTLSVSKLDALSKGLGFAKYKVDRIIELMQNG